jgi:hypothetical protein
MKKFYRNVIVKNCVKCNSCGDIIESKSGHDFRTCRCGDVSVDGGKQYLRRVFKSAECYIELSETYEEERDSYDWELKTNESSS